MWFNLIGMAVKTGAKIYSDKQKTKQALSEAKLLHAEKMKRDWKDEFVLIVLSTPIIMLGYSVFAEDPEIEQKLNLFFEKLNEMPYWLVGLWVSIVAAIYGIKATDIIKKK